MKYILIILLVIVIFITAITFGAHNNQIVIFNYFLAQGLFRISTLLTIFFAAGFIIGWVICGLFWLRVRIALIQTKRKVKYLEKQLALLIKTTNSELTKVHAVLSKE